MAKVKSTRWLYLYTMIDLRISIWALVILLWTLPSCEALYKPEVMECRCEYPLEDVYLQTFSSKQLSLPGLTYDVIDDFVLLDGILIIPHEHEACSYLQYVCDASAARFPWWE